MSAGPETRSLVASTGKLDVTTWLASDLEDLHRLQSDPAVMRYMVSGVQDREQTRARLAGFIEAQQTPGWTKWRVADPTGRLVGRAGFGRPHGGRFRELGYLLAPQLWGQGHATALARVLLQWHHDHPESGLARCARARVHRKHPASRAVLEHIGMTMIGTDPNDHALLVYQSSCSP